MELILKYFPQLTSLQKERFFALDGLYQEWNQQINVISRKDMEGLYEKHVLHSLSIAAIFNIPPGSSVIDIGTGGGFPGIPLAIYFPEVHFHLVDSIGKKIKVVRGVMDALQLSNVTAEQTRAEALQGRQFDIAVSRAVAPLKELIRWSRPLLGKARKKDTLHGLLCLKGGDLAQEIAESDYLPRLYPIQHYFSEGYFKEKYLLQVPL